MKQFRRVETIKSITVTDYVKLTDLKIERDGPSKSEAKVMTIKWFGDDNREIPESSQTYAMLEAAFHQLPEDD